MPLIRTTPKIPANSFSTAILQKFTKNAMTTQRRASQAKAAAESVQNQTGGKEAVPAGSNELQTDLFTATPPEAPPQPKPGSQWWKPAVYYNPVVSPLKPGPDFSFLDGRKPPITSYWEFERRKKQVQLGKRIVLLLSELREAEQLHKERQMHKTLAQERIEQWTPRAKGEEEIF